MFGTTAWDVLEEENREQPQVFGSAFPRPPSGQSDGPVILVDGQIYLNPEGVPKRWNGSTNQFEDV